MKVAALVLGSLVAIASSNFANADVQYEMIVGDGNGGREAAKLVRVGVSTAPNGEPTIEFYTDNSVAPTCSAGVKSVADALALESTIRKYSNASEKTLKVWCTQFRAPESKSKNFINVVFPAL